MGGRSWTHVSSGNTSTAFDTANGFPAPFSDKYALFAFDTTLSSSPQTFYGWIHLSFTVDPQVGANPAFGPDLIIHDYAWEDSGQALAAGAAGIPEPGTAASTGLAALALGAVGLRKWRKARQAA